jgi:transcriptional regulator with XRE-family HTH domain
VEKSKFLRQLGERLSEERARLGLTQAEIAELADVTRRTQINYESGERAPDAAYLVSLDNKGIDSLYVVTGRRESAGGALALSEARDPYEIKGLKPANVRTASLVVLDAVCAAQGRAKKCASPIDSLRVAEAIIVLAEMSETVDDVKRNAAHVLRLLK